MKTFLKYLLSFLLGILLAPLYAAGLSAWIWVPFMFSEFSFFGGFWLGLIIGLVVSIGTKVLVEMLPNN